MGKSCWEDFFPGERLHRKVTGSVEDGTGIKALEEHHREQEKQFWVLVFVVG